MRKTVAFLLAICILFCLVACTDNSINSTKSLEDRIEEKVEGMATSWCEFYTVGGKDLKSSYCSVTNIEKVSDEKYVASGTFTAVDIYGARWTNSFDIDVSYNQFTDEISVTFNQFRFVNKSWNN